MAACNTVIAKIDGSPNMHILRFRPRSQQTIQCCKHMHMQHAAIEDFSCKSLVPVQGACAMSSGIPQPRLQHPEALNLHTQRRSTYTPGGAQPTHLVGGGVAALVARVALQRAKVQQRRAAHQALQLGRAEQVDGRPAAQHHEAARKRLKLRGTG